jgi:hypothetical protein
MYDGNRGAGYLPFSCAVGEVTAIISDTNPKIIIDPFMASFLSSLFGPPEGVA